ncbi:MAG: hypothetical protein MUF07_09270 [Steroidobacteraceae bacterium]|nr:hypothetical protein [Steroidobacteraceae bacterium]
MSTEREDTPRHEVAGTREPASVAEVHLDAGEARPRGRRQPAQWRMIFVTGLFAATVYAATEGLLRMAVDAPPATSPGREAPAPAPPGEGGPAPGGPAPATGPTPAPAPAPAPGATPATAGERPSPAGETPAAGDPGDTNEAEPAEGPRRAAPPKSSDEEAPEFRESADNNISLPIDI